MTISLTTDNQTISRVEALAAKMLNQPSIRAQRLGKGANSRVFMLENQANVGKYVGKFYFRHPMDSRDRLQTEFSSFSFLRMQGFSDVPRPIAANHQDSCAIYEFVEGHKILSEELTIQDIAQAVDFLRRLKDLNTTARSYHFVDASDACFSINAIIASIEGRLGRFVKIEEGSELRSFLENDFRPLLVVLNDWARQYCRQNGISFENEISMGEKTLSPSDFGFHNALRNPKGRIVFLDFEYFGWDDPAKTVVDLLWHPAIALTEPLKKEFVRQMLGVFSENKQLAKRVALVYPLFGMKWCTIVLNEFVANDFSRRVYAAGDSLDREQICAEQLRKAKQLFRKIKETYVEFPYHG